MTVKKKIQIQNNSVDFKDLKDTDLSIQLSLDGFSFCILNKIQNEIISLCHYSFPDSSPTPKKHLQNVKEVFEKENLLKNKFAAVNITHINNLSSFVPKALFNEELLTDYLKFSHKVFTNDYLVYDQISNHDLVNVYVPFVNINNFFIDKFGSFNYKHSSTVLVENLLDTYKFSERPHLFVMVNDKHFEIVAIADNKFQLYNSFQYHTKEDFIYYLLFTAEQLQFNPEDLELIFLGNTGINDEIYRITYKYIRNVSFLENRNVHTLNKDISEEEQRKFFILLHQN
ncbi:MAG: DUF3822 family protein [Bacteroidota bacterium]